MIEFSLSDGTITRIDDADLPLVEGVRWWPSRTKQGKTYVVTRLPGGVVVGMHRLILSAPRGVWVDHIDGDGLNNQRYNIRLATPSQNACHHKGKRAGCTSAYRGVYWNKAMRKWHASIKADGPAGRRTSLGAFDSEADAARAYDIAARASFGEFATLNFPTK